jgi:acyl carrier protein/nodulation protein F
MDDVESKVVDIIVARMPPGSTTPKLEDELTGLGLDSLDTIEVMFSLEEGFGINLPVNANDAGSQFKTIADVVALVRRTLAEKAAKA